MLELEQKSECCTKNEVWQTEKPFGHFIILDLADFQLLPFLLFRSTTTSTPALSKAQLCQFFFLQRKNHMCSGSLLLLQRWGDLQRFCAKKTAHESPWVAISGTWSWRTQGERHEGPGDWRPQRFYIQRGAKHGESHTFQGEKHRSFRICGAESSSGQGKVDTLWSPKKHRFGRWQVPVVSSAADKGRLVALNTSSFRGTKTLKISKAIEFQQTNAAIWGLNCKVLQEATRECWDNLFSLFSFLPRWYVWRYSLSSFGSPLQASTAPPSSCMPRFEGNDLRLKLWHCHLPSCFLVSHRELTFLCEVEHIGSIMLESY